MALGGQHIHNSNIAEIENALHTKYRAYAAYASPYTQSTEHTQAPAGVEGKGEGRVYNVFCGIEGLA